MLTTNEYQSRSNPDAFAYRPVVLEHQPGVHRATGPWHPVEGSVQIPDAVSCVQETPENIVFRCGFTADQYAAIEQACCYSTATAFYAY